ncbi:unnamed protein product [Owenia fusiformis]|uniref:Uncharacterized protein n=1 Tax=Owenia fusiformis TaxID=6347 RepID=A0A8J1UKT0_OWEFU|nr:unnamed protein product [Owenia fusiformis]
MSRYAMEGAKSIENEPDLEEFDDECSFTYSDIESPDYEREYDLELKYSDVQNYIQDQPECNPLEELASNGTSKKEEGDVVQEFDKELGADNADNTAKNHTDDFIANHSDSHESICSNRRKVTSVKSKLPNKNLVGPTLLMESRVDSSSQTEAQIYVCTRCSGNRLRPSRPLPPIKPTSPIDDLDDDMENIESLLAPQLQGVDDPLESGDNFVHPDPTLSSEDLQDLIRMQDEARELYLRVTANNPGLALRTNRNENRNNSRSREREFVYDQEQLRGVLPKLPKENPHEPLINSDKEKSTSNLRNVDGPRVLQPRAVVPKYIMPIRKVSSRYLQPPLTNIMTSEAISQKLQEKLDNATKRKQECLEKKKSKLAQSNFFWSAGRKHYKELHKHDVELQYRIQVLKETANRGIR